MLRVTGERLWYPATRNSSISYRTSYQYSTISCVRYIISDIQHTRLADTLCKFEMKIVILAILKAYRTKSHDDVIKWKYFPRYWPFARGIHRPPVISPHKGQWREALMFLWSVSKWTAEKAIVRLVIMTQSCPLWRHCNAEEESLIVDVPQELFITYKIIMIICFWNAELFISELTSFRTCYYVIEVLL